MTAHDIAYRRTRNTEVNGVERGVYNVACGPCGWADEVIGFKSLVAAAQAHKRVNAKNAPTLAGAEAGGWGRST